MSSLAAGATAREAGPGARSSRRSVVASAGASPARIAVLGASGYTGEPPPTRASAPLGAPAGTALAVPPPSRNVR